MAQVHPIKGLYCDIESAKVIIIFIKIISTYFTICYQYVYQVFTVPTHTTVLVIIVESNLLYFIILFHKAIVDLFDYTYMGFINME